MSRFSNMFNTQPPPQYKPYDDEGGASGMAGDMFSGAMNVLDLPGSMVRDAISFSNPFDQLVTPFSDKNRTTGAQISKYWAGGDEDSAGNQLAGLVIDVLTDPMMLATGGTAAVGRAGLAGGKAALKGLGKAAKSIKTGYVAGADNTVLGKMAAKNRPFEQATSRAASLESDLVTKYGDRAQWDPTKGQVGRSFNPSVSQDKRMYQDLLNAEKDAFRSQADFTPREEMLGKAMDAYKADPMLGVKDIFRPIVGGAQGASQLGSSMMGGVRQALGTAYNQGTQLLGRGIGRGVGAQAPMRQRDALGQLAAIGTNTAQTATGQRMSQEPTLEEMIAQALAEDPQLMEELLMAMGAGETGY